MDGVARTAYYASGCAPTPAPQSRSAATSTRRVSWMRRRKLSLPCSRTRRPHAPNAVRARIFDDWLNERLAADPATRVILLGAGFDTRAFRLSGGDWVELDHPGLMALKEQKLPASEAKNPLSRTGIDLAVDSLVEKLELWRDGRPTIVVMEGVTAYSSTPSS